MGERTYDWVEEDGDLLSAACFTAAVGVTVDDVLRALGADHSTGPTATFAASLVAWFDPVLVEHPWSGSDPGWVRERARDLRFGVGRSRSDALVLLERLTGVRVERSWLERPHRCFDVPDPESAPLSVGAYTSFVRQALRAWWRSLLGRR